VKRWKNAPAGAIGQMTWRRSAMEGFGLDRGRMLWDPLGAPLMAVDDTDPQPSTEALHESWRVAEQRIHDADDGSVEETAAIHDALTARDTYHDRTFETQCERKRRR
jgi:hypothetical protein